MSDKNKVLASLEEDLNRFREIFKEARQQIINENVSNYPIFVAFNEEIDLGSKLIDHDTSSCNWSFNATTLEELVVKKIIEMEKVDNFRSLYNGQKNQLCVFLFNEKQAEFVFFPLYKS